MMPANKIDSSDFEDAGLRLLDLGYPIVPIAKGLKHPNMAGWQDINADPAGVKSWAQSGHYSGWGVKAKEIGGLDVDVYDKGLALLVYKFIKKEAPELTIARFGFKPKHLFAFRNVDKLTKQVSKSFINPADPVHTSGPKDGEAKIQRIEMLGDGQQWICFGEHVETKGPYVYTGDSVFDIAAADIPELPKIKIGSFIGRLFDYFENSAVASGWVEHSARGSDSASITPISDFEARVKAQQVGDWTSEEVLDDLDLISSNCSREKWLQIAMAIHHQYQGDEEGFDIFNDWSYDGGEAYGGMSDCRHRWDSFKLDGSKNSTTFATVHKLANDIRGEIKSSDRDSKDQYAESTRELFSLADLKGKAPEVQWGWHEYMPVGETTLLYADGGAGKSMVALQLACSIALGQPMFGVPTKKGKVLFISCEDDKGDLHRRLENIEKNMMVTRDQLSDVHILTVEDGMLMTFEKDEGRRTKFYDYVDALCREHSYTSVTIDTAADTFGGNEIIKSEVRQYVRSLTALARRNSTAVFMLAHPSQAGMSSGLGTSGNVGWNNSARSRIYMRWNDPRSSADPTLTFQHMKSNKGPLHPDLTLINQQGFMRNLTSAEVEDLGHHQIARDQFLELLAIVTEQGDTVGPSSNGGDRYAPRRFVALQRLYPDFESITMSDYVHAMETLRIDKVIEVTINNRNQRSDITLTEES